jgi:hypothetical protein
MIDELELMAKEDGRLRCTFCGETMESEGFDPFELIQTTHYCANVSAPEFVEPQPAGSAAFASRRP